MHLSFRTCCLSTRVETGNRVAGTADATVAAASTGISRTTCGVSWRAGKLGPTPPAGRDAQHVGRTRIDRALPRGPRDSPWVVRLEDDADAVVAGEIASLGFDGFVGVDTGGDSVGQVRNRPGRDQRMLSVLAAARGSADVPLWLLILGPGSDGQSSEAELREAFAARAAVDEYAGWFPLDPFLPVFRTFAPELDETRTLRIILAAEDDTLATDRQNRVIVPRGKRPPIPRPWLLSGFAFKVGHSLRE